jgi:hypothetical protein
MGKEDARGIDKERMTRGMFEKGIGRGMYIHTKKV